MQCIFLMHTGKACHCEVLAVRHGDARKLPSSSVCENAWESLCPLYKDAMGTGDDRVDKVADEIPRLHPSRIGHFNRIGGYRVLLPHRI
jgi:hypothetical protein